MCYPCVRTPVAYVSGLYTSEGDGVTGGWLFEGFEVEQFVAVVFVLFSAQGDLSRQAALEIVNQGFKAVLSTPPCMHYPPPRFE